MQVTPELARRLEAHVRSNIKDAMEEVAIEITEEVRNYVARTLYTRPKSKYYDRDGYNGGFIGTFADASNASRIVDEMMRTQGDKIYVTFVLRDFSDINYEPPTSKQFGHHTSFEGVETSDSRAQSEMDDLINNGWEIITPHKSYYSYKRIEGIHFREYAKDYVNKYANGMLAEKLKQRGLEMSSNTSIGRKRMSVPIDDIQIIIE